MKRSWVCTSNNSQIQRILWKRTTIVIQISNWCSWFENLFILKFTFSKIHSLWYGSPQFQHMSIASTYHSSHLTKISNEWTHTHTHPATFTKCHEIFWPLHTKDQNIHWEKDNSDLVNILVISKGIVRLSCPRDLSYCPSDSNLSACSVETLHPASLESLFSWLTL